MKKTLFKTAITIILISCVYLLNQSHRILYVPSIPEETDIHMSFITINTVFAGFSFTTLGILLGLTGENFVKKIKTFFAIEFLESYRQEQPCLPSRWRDWRVP